MLFYKLADAVSHTHDNQGDISARIRKGFNCICQENRCFLVAHFVELINYNDGLVSFRERSHNPYKIIGGNLIYYLGRIELVSVVRNSDLFEYVLCQRMEIVRRKCLDSYVLNSLF